MFEYFDAHANEMFEEEPLKELAKDNQLAAFKHTGFGNAWILLEIRIIYQIYGIKEQLHGSSRDNSLIY